MNSDAGVQRGGDQPCLQPTQIFVVDDDFTIRELMSFILGATGYKYTVFPTGDAALDAFELCGVKPQVLITDYSMPGMDGIELISRCRAIDPNLKAFLISGTVDGSILREVPVKVDAFMSKPFLVKSFLETLRRLIGS